MKNIFPLRFTIISLLVILSLFILFHVLVIVGVIPFSVVWGGRLMEKSEMMVMEMVSIFVNLLALLIVIIKAAIIKVKINNAIVTIGLWTMFAIFILNTVGNLLSNNNFEMAVFTPVTIILAILSLRLALSGRSG